MLDDIHEDFASQDQEAVGGKLFSQTTGNGPGSDYSLRGDKEQAHGQMYAFNDIQSRHSEQLRLVLLFENVAFHFRKVIRN